MARHITIVHLSDLQFGQYHRYPDGDDPYANLYAKLADDLDHLADRHELRPTAIVVTGDVAEQSAPEEYDAARSFLEKLTAKLAIARRRVVMVPGNHDVNWKLCQGARLMAEGAGRSVDPLCFSKFGNYQQFFRDFYADPDLVFDEEHLFQLFPFPDEQVLLVGLNSCVRESERPDDHYGWIGVHQARMMVQACRVIDPDHRWLRIAALHHNFVGASDLDNENLRDRDAVLPILEQGRFRLVLHGHRHIAAGQTYGGVAGQAIKIVAAGSAGLDRETLPDHPNQYQVIHIEDRRSVTLYMRQYSAQSFGLTGQGKWTADPSINESGIVQFDLDVAPSRLAVASEDRTDAIADARQRLLDYLSEEHRYMQLRGFGPDLRVPIELEPVYIALRAVPSHAETDLADRSSAGRQAHEELEIAPALQYCRERRYGGMIVLGDPGSGKTTLLKYLTLCLARQKRTGQGEIAEDWYPLLLPLRGVDDFSSSLADALTAYYPTTQMGLPGDFFRRVLADRDEPCLLMLDGLDEVATPERRMQALEWIECQRKLFPHNLILVTSRFAGYRGQTRLPESYLELHVRDLGEDDVRDFVRRWYEQVETRQRGDARQWRDLGLRQSEDMLGQLSASPSLMALACNPLMLQIICLVHRTHGAMPKRRTELYEECIKVLLQKWDEAKGLEVFLTAAEARQVLRPLALWLHEEEGRTYADDEQVKRVIGPHLARVKRETKEEAEAQLDRVLTSVRDRSGLFTGFDVTRYGFQHLSFQEFLAAEEIVKQGLHGRLVEQFGRSWWRETTLLALGMDDPRFQTALFTDLLRSPQCGKNLDLALACVRDALAPCVGPFAAGVCDGNLSWEVRHNCALFLREIGGSEAVQALRAALQDPDRRVTDAARNALVRLGEVVQAAAATPGVAADTIVNAIDGTELVRVPAGEFLMGSDDGRANERPQQRLHLDQYHIARHPVTNAQYRRFLDATGHAKPRHWDDKRLNQENQPVVGVTWHDAMKYCEWAGLRLPTEREWEKAARGSDGRRWPWGDESPDEKRCNFAKNVGAPSEIGSYPEGASPYGCLDMAGNVWEWCATKWRESYGEPPDDLPDGNATRVLRGGSWFSSADGVRCACRRRNFPDVWDGNYGFRCAQ